MTRRVDLPAAALLAVWSTLLLAGPVRAGGLAPLVIMAFLSLILPTGAAPSSAWARAARTVAPALIGGALLGRSLVGWGALPVLVLPGVVVVTSALTGPLIAAPGRAAAHAVPPRATWWAAVALTAGLAALAFARGQPTGGGWDALRPTWSAMAVVWGPACVAAAAPAAWEGTTEGPSTTRPVTLLATLALAWAVSASWSAAPDATPMLPPIAVMMLALAGIPVALRAGPVRRGVSPTLTLTAAGVATAMLDETGAQAVLTTFVPAMLGAERLWTGWQARHPGTALAGALLAAGAIGAWPGLPAAAAPAAWLGLTVGGALWVVGLTALADEASS